MKTIGIISQGPATAAVFFTRCCDEGALRLGALMHPQIVMATAAVGLTLPAYYRQQPEIAVPYLKAAIDRLHGAGADFYVCAANISHWVINLLAEEMSIPCLHVADVVAEELVRRDWRRVGLLSNRFTMTGTIYRRSFRAAGIEKLIPEAAVHARFDEIIFREAPAGLKLDASRDLILAEIDKFKDRGADCVVMGGLELPSLVPPELSSLPVIDPMKLLPRAAVAVAVSDEPLRQACGWVLLGAPSEPADTTAS